MPHFNYCSTVLFLCDKKQIHKLQLIQNRAMRIILRCDYLTPRQHMLDSLNWLSINQQIKFNVLIMIFKIVNGLMPKYLSDKLVQVRDVHDRNVRSQNDLRLPNYRTENARNNIFYSGLKMYKELPNEIKLIA